MSPHHHETKIKSQLKNRKMDTVTIKKETIDNLLIKAKKRDTIIVQGHTEDEKSWKAHDRLVREKESILMTKRILEKDDL